MEKKIAIEKALVNADYLASALGVTRRRINQLIREKVLIRHENGEIPLLESLRRFYENKYRAEGATQGDYWQEKTKHEKIKREMTEINLAKIRNQMHDARNVEMVMTEMLTNLRTQLMGLPSKLAPQLDGKSKVEIFAAMTKEIEEKLAELSEYNPAMFTEEEIINDETDD